MPLTAHLAELRRRLIWSLLAVLVLFFLCFHFADAIFNFLTLPLLNLWQAESGRRMIYTALHEKFFANIKLGFWAAACLALPFILMQIWLFIAPGLYRAEKRFALPLMLATPLMFLAGAGFVYYLVMPVAWSFFLGFEQTGDTARLAIEAELKVADYLSLVMRLILAFGLAFQLPILLLLLLKSGLVRLKTLRDGRRWAIVLAFVAAAILTPPDPLSQIALALPIIALYEATLLIGRLIPTPSYREERTDS